MKIKEISKIGDRRWEMGNYPISYLLSAIYRPAGPGVDGLEVRDNLKI